MGGPKLFAFAIACLLLASCTSSNDDLAVAPNVDLARFQGKWHEIAHLPRPMQRDCTGTVATYTARADGSFAFTHECTLKSGAYLGTVANAIVSDQHVPAKLSVDFGGYTGDYWILDVASDYRYAVVGHPSRQYLWILSRTATMTPEDRNAAHATAKERGFDLTHLEDTPLGPEPAGAPTPPPRYGVSSCASAPRPSSPAALAALGLVAIAWLVRHRRRVSRCHNVRQSRRC